MPGHVPRDSGAQVLIVGAGPVGLTLANDLASRGVPIRIIDSLAVANPHAKAHGLQSRTLEALDAIGLGRRMVDHSLRPEPTLMNFDRGRLILERPAGGPPHEPYPFQLGIWQQTIETVLATALVEHGVEVERNSRLESLQQDDDGVAVTIAHNGVGEEARFGWVVGCDGGRSVVRSELGLRMRGYTEPGKWFIGEFDMDWSMPRDVMYHNRARDGAAVACFDPLTLKWHAWITMTDDSQALTLENFNALWAKYTRSKVQITNPLWMHELRVNYSTADRYVIGRVVLAGDAAHVHSSAGGQGLNTGVQDVLNLGWKLDLVRSGRAAADLLETYNVERLAEAHKVLELSRRMHRTMYPTRPIEHVVSRLMSAAMRRPKFAERFAARRMSMLHIQCADSPLSVNRSTQATPNSGAGFFLPDAHVRVNGTAAHVYDLLRGPTAEILLCCGEAPDHATIVALDKIRQRIPQDPRLFRVHWVVSSDRDRDLLSPEEKDEIIIDSARTLRRALGLAGPEVIFVRPDHYIGYRNTTIHDDQALVDYLGMIYDRSVLSDGRRQ